MAHFFYEKKIIFYCILKNIKTKIPIVNNFNFSKISDNYLKNYRKNM